MPYILPGIVPLQVSNDCVDTKPLNCGEPSSDSTSTSFNILYPEGATTLPMAGGAVIAIGAGDLKLSPSKNTENVITRNLSVLQKLELQNKIEDLSKVHVAVNNALYDIARRDLKVLDPDESKRKAPNVYFSIYKGEDPSTIKDGIANPYIVRICEFRYIPFEAFAKIMTNLVGDDKNIAFNNVVGVSGRTFDELDKSAADQANDEDVTDLVLEFFPVVNISEDTISSVESNPVIGGYYTLKNDKIYLKMPDLSGRNSAGESNSIITNDDSIFLEVASGPALTRIEIDDFKMPPIAAFLGSQQDEFPDGISLDLEFELAEDEDGLEVFLSPILNGAVVNKRKSLNTYAGGVELFSVPLLTQGIEEGREGIINENSKPPINDVEALAPVVDLYYPGFSEEIFIYKEVGYPYSSNIDANIFFGEKNRPEIILSNEGEADRKNDRRYHNVSSYGALDTLTSVMPKIYNSVPSKWFKAIAQGGDGVYSASFESSNFENIDLTSIGGTLEYAAYIKDSLGQITKISGPNISLTKAIPSISEISPNGFNGSPAIVLDQTNIIQIRGEDLKGVERITFVGQSDGTTVELVPGQGPASDATSTSITLSFNAGDMLDLNVLSTPFTLTTQAYEVTLTGSSGVSGKDQIYVVIDSTEDRPVKTAQLAEFKTNEFKSTEFGTRPIVGIPLFKNGQSASIGLKSRGKVFSGTRNVYAYIALPNESNNIQRLQQFSFSEDMKEVTVSNGYNLDGAKTLVVPTNVQYTFSQSITSDFYKNPGSNKRATLNFPGNAYAAYNFSSLQNLGEVYILLTNRPIPELTGSSTTYEFSEEQHCVVRLGDQDPTARIPGPAFIEASTILGIAADVGASGKVSSTFQKETYQEGTFDASFGNADFVIEEINVFGKIERAVLIVSGVKEKFLRKRYTIKLGGKDISNKYSRNPDVIGTEGKILFELSNITPASDGILEFTVDKKEKRFGSNYTASGYSAQATALISKLFVDIDEKTRSLSTSLKLDAESLITDTQSYIDGNEGAGGIVGLTSTPESNVLESLLPNGSKNGLIFDPLITGGGTGYVPFIPIDITPSTKIELGLSLLNSDLTTLSPGFSETGIGSLDRTTLNIGNGALFPSGSYIINQNDDAALLFFSASVQNLAAVKYNVPEVVAMGQEGADLIELDSGEEIKIVVGQKYDVLVKNTDRHFVLKFDEITLKPRGLPRDTDTPGTYIATIEAPITMLDVGISKDNCFDVCASTDNATRNRAKWSLGRDFTIDLEEIFEEMLLGPLKDKIPDIEGLFEKLADAPLRFVQFILDNPLIPKDLIKSFCDLSFHLLAELKISLNGFRVLMIPIQVIFCIIDVICALLNPFKVAKAVIRLFECLYDLILLLPIIAVPVMFLQLILHLLELIQCVIDKILFTITAINEISRAINLAAQTPINFAAIKALEETLSEYLFEIEADLKFLEPILSILAIFLQLLQLLFRFPCQIDPGEGQPDCGVDGTLLAGIVAGIAAPDLDTIDPNVMLPVGQTYSTDTVEGSTSSVNEPAVGTAIANNSGQTYLESMNINEDTLRANGSFSFDATMAPTFTKLKKRGGKPTEVEFRFKGKGETTALNKKNIDPNQTVDAPLAFLRKNNSNLEIAEYGNLYSPVDGSAFLDVNSGSGTASVKPLVVELEIPIFGADPDTGAPIQTGTEIVTRTFDNIPKMVIMDDEFNTYFIVKDGIEYNSDGFVESITAEIVNIVSAPKLKFSREEVEIDTDGDGTEDDTIKIFDFPQLYFFDMRQASDLLEQFCATASINNFPFEDNNADDIEDIVEEASDCLNTWVSGVQGLVTNMRAAQISGVLPLPEIDVEVFQGLNEEVIDCLGGTVDDMCKFVVNSLNTSFKVLEDDDITPRLDAVDRSISDEALDTFETLGPAFTGAREFAAGIGDSAEVNVGSVATIELIPRDAYDEEILGDLTNKIAIEIISDTTGDASFIREGDGILSRDGSVYTVKLTSGKVGEVKLRARICDRTIQAITFDGIEAEAGSETTTDIEVDCIPDTASEITSGSPPLGALTKIDRILTVYFVKPAASFVGAATDGDSGAKLPITNPQEFGTSLEN